ncbi:exosortase N [Aureispira anguillae]|uniref:Exosortase N n=1 Tax=Aureispira anguillae TaxID=2864201 RepID=A0A915YE37_9BACT|nr:exosortase N [Aureispira anguillae]BDS11423.1 exosortase N [Aureispira anguillae]
MLNSKTVLIGSLIAIATTLGIPVWMEYLQGGFLFYCTILLAPYILYVQQKEVASTRYAWASLISALGHLYLGMNILYLAAYLFFVLFLVEWKWGKLNALSIYWIFILSPLTVFLFSVFSFPIRLELSRLASWLLHFIQPQLSCQGNIILLHGTAFSVDEACMGLNMVSYSYLVILVLIAYFEQQLKKQLAKAWIIIILSLGTVLILLANLFRIIAIILAQAMPETFAHEAIGILSWLFYVVLPTFFLVKFVVQQWGGSPALSAPKTLPPALLFGLLSSCLLLLGVGSYQTLLHPPVPPLAIVPTPLNGFEQTITQGGVVQLKNEEALIYIKPACAPYRADHSPNICWKGSGYSFSKEQIQTIGNRSILTAQLQKGNDILYTAWWYDNGNHQTTSQIEWRWNALKGKGHYQLINITVEEEALLEKYLSSF